MAPAVLVVRCPSLSLRRATTRRADVGSGWMQMTRGVRRRSHSAQRAWVIQVAAALTALLALSVVTAVLDVDTNIDTGSNLAKGLFLVGYAWVVVASAGLVVSALIAVGRRRRG